MRTEIIENRIKRGREEKGYKQSDLAFILGHNSSSRVSCYERGLILPDSKNLIKLCHCLNTVPEWLYPDIIRRWKEEAEIAAENLRNKRYVSFTSYEQRQS
jgi:transcriptional regulator with XRE-family HTH domain